MGSTIGAGGTRHRTRMFDRAVRPRVCFLPGSAFLNTAVARAGRINPTVRDGAEAVRNVGTFALLTALSACFIPSLAVFVLIARQRVLTAIGLLA